MEVKDLAKADHLHHAYIVEGGEPSAILAMLEARGVAVYRSADILQLTYGEMGVDDARSIAGYAFLKSVGESKYFIISFDKATDAAQNALLKVVEEAPGNTIFFFCVQSEGHLLPTLRSRCVSVQAEGSTQRAEGSDAKEFLKHSYVDRLAMVDKLVASAQKSQDRTPIRTFVRSLLHEAHTAHTTPKALRAILDADHYLRLSGSSPKIVLSHLAVSLPLL